MRAKRFGAVAVVLSLALFGGACSDDDGDDDAATTTQPSVAPSVVPPASSDDPRRDTLLAVVESDEISAEEAECTTDAAFEELPEEQIALLVEIEPGAEADTLSEEELAAVTEVLRVAAQRCGWTGLTGG